MNAATPMFIADAMLGRLAAWLRLLGIDTIYDPRVSDLALIRRASREGRILLTRDRRLLRRRHLPPHLYIRSDHFRMQLAQVLETFDIDPAAHLFERCSRCNTVLETIPKTSVSGRVPPYVFASQEAFALCPSCGRVYWPATHVERIKQELEHLRHPQK